MIAMHLAKAVGGNLLLGFLSAVAFATILAVVSRSGAWLGAAAISHDIYARVIRKGKATEDRRTARVPFRLRGAWASWPSSSASPSRR